MRVIEKNFAKRFRNLRLARGLTQERFIEQFNKKYNRSFTCPAISQYENQKRIPEIDALMDFADFFDVSIDYLLGTSDLRKNDIIESLDNIRPIKTKKIPLLGEIACGEPRFANEEHESYIEASSDIEADFCLIAKGESMIGARIHDGDVVFIKSQQMVNNGEIAAVIIEDEATLKRWYFYPEKAKLILNPENPAYEPLVYVGEELNSIRCLGKAVCFMSNL